MTSDERPNHQTAKPPNQKISRGGAEARRNFGHKEHKGAQRGIGKQLPNLPLRGSAAPREDYPPLPLWLWLSGALGEKKGGGSQGNSEISRGGGWGQPPSQPVPRGAARGAHGDGQAGQGQRRGRDDCGAGGHAAARWGAGGEKQPPKHQSFRPGTTGRQDDKKKKTPAGRRTPLSLSWAITCAVCGESPSPTRQGPKGSSSQAREPHSNEHSHPHRKKQQTQELHCSPY